MERVLQGKKIRDAALSRVHRRRGREKLSRFSSATELQIGLKYRF